MARKVGGKTESVRPVELVVIGADASVMDLYFACRALLASQNDEQEYEAWQLMKRAVARAEGKPDPTLTVSNSGPNGGQF